MRTKSFQDYLEKRLSKEEIAEIEAQAKLEIKVLKALQKEIANAMSVYMEKSNIGFNELVRRLDASPTHVAKIQKGEANLTLASLAHISALMGQEPQLVFKRKK
jgi:transcriptional regulator with XRE-family HTH domain